MTRHGAKVPDYPLSPKDKTVWNCTLNTLDYFSNDESQSVKLGRIYRKKYMRNRQQILGNCSEGQLTSIGSEMHIKNGQNFRNRYINQYKFLNDNFSANEIYIRSTDMDRTIHSAQSLMKGLYPEINQNQSVTIEIETNNLNSDNMFSKPCHELKEMCSNVEKSTTWKNYMLKYQNLLKQIQTSANSELEFYQFLEYFEAMIAQGIPLPPGITIPIVQQIYNISASQMGMIYSNIQIPKLAIGLFMSDFLQDLQNKLSNKSSTKFSLYSAHDTTLGMVLNLLKLFDQNPIWPPFAAHLVFEYWRESDGNISVEIYYQDKQLVLPQCNSVSCPLSVWMSYLQQVSLSESQFSRLCSDSNQRRASSNLSVLKDDLVLALCS